MNIYASGSQPFEIQGPLLKCLSQPRTTNENWKSDDRMAQGCARFLGWTRWRMGLVREMVAHPENLSENFEIFECCLFGAFIDLFVKYEIKLQLNPVYNEQMSLLLITIVIVSIRCYI